MSQRSEPTAVNGEPTESGPVEVAILGSCISRDNFNSRFNPTYKQFYVCPLVQNQSSIISLMSEPVHLDGDLTGEMSKYDRWNVRTDLTKEFLDDLRGLQPAYLILDFFGDVHFGCIRLDDGRYLTNNRWKLWRTDYYAELKESGAFTEIRIEDDFEAYLKLWSEAFDRLAAFVEEFLPQTTVILHRGHNTDLLTLPDKIKPVSLSKRRKRLQRLDVERANKAWSLLDDHAVKVLGCPTIDLTTSSYPTFYDHPWGPFYVHYGLEYYHQFLAELHKIHIRATAGDEIAAMVTDVEVAAEEKLRLEHDVSIQRLRRLQSRLKVQNQRIKALESTTLRRAVRRSLGAARRRVMQMRGSDRGQ